MGTCNGVLSSCAIGGYAMESRYVIVYLAFPQGIPPTYVFCMLASCHLGNIIEYDTVTNMSWSVDVRTHAIAQLIDKVLAKPWPAAEEQGREVPPLKRQDDCVVISFRNYVRFVAYPGHRRTVINGILGITPYDSQPLSPLNKLLNNLHTETNVIATYLQGEKVSGTFFPSLDKSCRIWVKSFSQEPGPWPQCLTRTRGFRLAPTDIIFTFTSHCR